MTNLVIAADDAKSGSFVIASLSDPGAKTEQLTRWRGATTGAWSPALLVEEFAPTANGKRVVIHELRKAAAGKFADIGWHTLRHISFVARRDRCADEGATGTHAPRLHPDHDERVRTGDAGVEERSQWEGSHDGAQALAGERLKCQFSYWE